MHFSRFFLFVVHWFGWWVVCIFKGKPVLSQQIKLKWFFWKTVQSLCQNKNIYLLSAANYLTTKQSSKVLWRHHFNPVSYDLWRHCVVCVWSPALCCCVCSIVVGVHLCLCSWFLYLWLEIRSWSINKLRERSAMSFLSDVFRYVLSVRLFYFFPQAETSSFF